MNPTQDRYYNEVQTASVPSQASGRCLKYLGNIIIREISKLRVSYLLQLGFIPSTSNLFHKEHTVVTGIMMAFSSRTLFSYMHKVVGSFLLYYKCVIQILHKLQT